MNGLRTLYELDVDAPFVDLTRTVAAELDEGRCVWWRSGSGALVLLTHVADQRYPLAGVVPVMVRHNRHDPIGGLDGTTTPFLLGGATSCGMWEQTLAYTSAPPVLVQTTPGVTAGPPETGRFVQLLAEAHAALPTWRDRHRPGHPDTPCPVLQCPHAA